MTDDIDKVIAHRWWYEARKRNVWKTESSLDHVKACNTRVLHCNAAIHKPVMHDNSKQLKGSPEESMKSDAADLDKSSSKSVVLSPSFVRFFVRDIVTGVVTGEGVNGHEN